jgi:teichoic acid transport system permease protein
MFKAMWFNLKEHKDNIYRIWQIAKNHMKKQTIRTTLGLGWIFIRDMIYFCVFLGFRYMMAGGRKMDGMHVIVYLATGLIPWFLMSEVLTVGSNAIIANKQIVLSIKFPVGILPTIEVLAIFMKRVFTLLFIFVPVVIFADFRDINILLIIYYFISMFILMLVINQPLTAFIAISKDFGQLYSAIIRVLVFSMPIIWSFEYIAGKDWLILLLKLNPMVYIILGFRDALVIGEMPDLEYTLYFWCVVLVMYAIGSYVQFKLKKYYADFI